MISTSAPVITTAQTVGKSQRHWYEFLWDRLDRPVVLALAWAAHGLLALAMKGSPSVATAHALVALLFGVYVCLVSRKTSEPILCMAYVVGSEVLWRATQAGIFYETGKYACILYSAILAVRLRSLHIPIIGPLMLACQIPGVVATVALMGFSSRTRMAVAFVISGPIALAALTVALSNVRVTRQELWRVVTVLSCPIVGFAIMLAAGIYGSNITFGTESNKDAAGGFGPNQVSSVLSFGAVMMMLWLSGARMAVLARLLGISGTLLVLVQSVLTFSRSGILGAAIAYVPALLYLVRDERQRLRAVMISGVLAMAGIMIYPYLMDLTGGALAKRYGSSDMTGREELMATDVEVWLKNPVWGVGLGLSNLYHHGGAASHNEITRWIAEHGLAGILMLLGVLATALHQVLRNRGLAQAFSASALTWSLIFLFTNGFRIAAPAFAFALGCLQMDRLNDEDRS